MCSHKLMIEIFWENYNIYYVPYKNYYYSSIKYNVKKFIWINFQIWFHLSTIFNNYILILSCWSVVKFYKMRYLDLRYRL